MKDTLANINEICKTVKSWTLTGHQEAVEVSYHWKSRPIEKILY